MPSTAMSRGGGAHTLLWSQSTGSVKLNSPNRTTTGLFCDRMQCAAVRTYLSLMRVPPQRKVTLALLRYPRRAIQGNWPMLAILPLMILFSVPTLPHVFVPGRRSDGAGSGVFAPSAGLWGASGRAEAGVGGAGDVFEGTRCVWGSK